jgi:uncharacterized protein involved in outer membrane biogenesis
MKLKIILGIVVLLVVLLVVAVLIVGAHLGDLVKAGMETAGPKVTQTTLTVDAVNISLLAGSAGVKGLALGNPEGYKAPQSISVGNTAISLVPSSVLSDKIVIHSIEVRAPEITFEGNPLGANNLSKIMDNVNAVTGSGANAGANAPAPAPAGEKKPGKKLEVDDFLITGATVHANLTGLVNKEITVTLPDIHLTDLGKGTDGITGADLTQKVLGEITAETIKTLISSATQLGKGMTDAAKNALNGAVQNTGLTGSNSVDKLKNGLGGLFGK